MNKIGVKLRKIHTLHIKKRYVNQLLKNKKESLNKKELRKLKKPKIQRMRLLIYLTLENVKHMHKINIKMQRYILFLHFLNKIAISTNLAKK